MPGPGAHAFPPAVAEPGSVGDAHYSPLVRVTNRRGLVLNATVVAFDVDADEIEFPAGAVDTTRSSTTPCVGPRQVVQLA